MLRSLDFRGRHNGLPGVVDAIDVLGRVPLFAGLSREDLCRRGSDRSHVVRLRRAGGDRNLFELERLEHELGELADLDLALVP
jgi:hypothetical protein